MRDSSRRFIDGMRKIGLPNGEIKDFIEDFEETDREKTEKVNTINKLMTELEYLRAENEALKGVR